MSPLLSAWFRSLREYPQLELAAKRLDPIPKLSLRAAGSFFLDNPGAGVRHYMHLWNIVVAKGSSIMRAPSEPSDSLVAMAKAGDKAAFDRLVQDFRPYLKVVAARMLGNQLAGKGDGSDVVQEALLAAFDNCADCRGHHVEEWQDWVMAILRNQVRKLRRDAFRQRRDPRRERPLAPVSSGDDQLAAPSSSPSAKASKREMTKRLMACVEKLSPEYRNVVLLRNIQELTFEEIARRTNRPKGAVYKLWVRAVRRLGELWGDDS
jgi:RNA polymerase sigma-70 factor (ECF subfamily)